METKHLDLQIGWVSVKRVVGPGPGSGSLFYILFFLLCIFFFLLTQILISHNVYQLCYLHTLKIELQLNV